MTKEEYIKYVMENELRNREPDIYDIEDAWVAGYNHAVNMTAEWMKEEVDVYDNEDNRLLQADMEEFVMNYKKSMKLRNFVEDAIEDVDLEKELYDFIEEQKAWVKDDRVVEYNNGDSFNHIYDLESVAKHFFELGLKAQKGGNE